MVPVRNGLGCRRAIGKRLWFCAYGGAASRNSRQFNDRCHRGEYRIGHQRFHARVAQLQGH